MIWGRSELIQDVSQGVQKSYRGALTGGHTPLIESDEDSLLSMEASKDNFCTIHLPLTYVGQCIHSILYIMIITT
jgi:hypothetical protein